MHKLILVVVALLLLAFVAALASASPVDTRLDQTLRSGCTPNKSAPDATSCKPSLVVLRQLGASFIVTDALYAPFVGTVAQGGNAICPAGAYHAVSYYPSPGGSVSMAYPNGVTKVYADNGVVNVCGLQISDLGPALDSYLTSRGVTP